MKVMRMMIIKVKMNVVFVTEKYTYLVIFLNVVEVKKKH